MSDTIETFIPYPSALRAGQTIVRVLKAGERVYERWKVVRWISPPPPPPGQSQASGFLRCVSVDDGEGRDFGPASLVKQAFRIEKEAVTEPESKPKRKLWYQDSD